MKLNLCIENRATSDELVHRMKNIPDSYSSDRPLRTESFTTHTRNLINKQES